jgi:hypothetical protein
MNLQTRHPPDLAAILALDRQFILSRQILDVAATCPPIAVPAKSAK